MFGEGIKNLNAEWKDFRGQLGKNKIERLKVKGKLRCKKEHLGWNLKYELSVPCLQSQSHKKYVPILGFVVTCEDIEKFWNKKVRRKNILFLSQQFGRDLNHSKQQNSVH